MAKNRLDLDFTLETNEKRAAFVNDYLLRNEFQQKPLTESELETIANYILWGRNADSGKNAVQDKSIQISTKHGDWDQDDKVESLDALIESPTFNEAQLSSSPTRYVVKAEKFSREKALANSDGRLKEQFIDLFQRIDWLDLQINFYELKCGKRTKPVRDGLLKKFNDEEQAKAKEKINHWTPYKYLKQRHELVELRREQYTLRDSISTVIVANTSNNGVSIPVKMDWDAEIPVFPLGLDNGEKMAQLIFKDADYLNPMTYSPEDLEKISKYYWHKKEQRNKPQKFFFDFTNLENVYELFQVYFEMEDAAEEESVESNIGALMRTLRYYIKLAELNDLQSDILNAKINKVKNADIAYDVNRRYNKNYTANYISTIFRQKIIPQINLAAEQHEKIVGLLFFEEEFKTCTCCGRTYIKSTDYFVKKARSKDGLSGRCKKCDKRERDEKKVIELVRKN